MSRPKSRRSRKFGIIATSAGKAIVARKKISTLCDCFIEKRESEYAARGFTVSAAARLNTTRISVFCVPTTLPW